MKPTFQNYLEKRRFLKGDVLEDAKGFALNDPWLIPPYLQIAEYALPYKMKTMLEILGFQVKEYSYLGEFIFELIEPTGWKKNTIGEYGEITSPEGIVIAKFAYKFGLINAQYTTFTTDGIKKVEEIMRTQKARQKAYRESLPWWSPLRYL